jgi:hypothetical protein
MRRKSCTRLGCIYAKIARRPKTLSYLTESKKSGGGITGEFHAEQRRNNPLPVSIDHATPIEIARLTRAIDRGVREGDAYDITAICAVQLMLFAGRPLEQICSIELAARNPFDYQDDDICRLVRFGQGYALSLPAGGSPTSADEWSRSANLVRPRGNKVVLGLGRRTIACLRRLLGPTFWDASGPQPAAWDNGTKLFKHDYTTLARLVDTFLGECDPFPRGKSRRRLLTHKQICSAVFVAMANGAQGDPARARIVIPASARTPVAAASILRVWQLIGARRQSRGCSRAGWYRQCRSPGHKISGSRKRSFTWQPSGISA